MAAYATTNVLAGLAAANFTPGSGPADATRGYLNDSAMAAQYVFTAAAAGNTLVVDLGAPVTMIGFGILNHNLATMASPGITILGADDAGFTTGVVMPFSPTTVPTTAPSQKEFCAIFNPTTKQYWKLTFGWTGTYALKLGELFAISAAVGGLTTLSRGSVDGSGETETLLLNSEQMQTGNIKVAFLAGPIRSRHWKTVDFTAAQRDELLALWRAVKGPVTPFLWLEAAVAGACNDCLFGRLQLDAFAWTWADYNLVQPPDFVLVSEGREVGS
jgi:hypothetical protein